MKCIKCGKEINKNASVCPYCQCIYHKNYKKLLIILLIISLIMLNISLLIFSKYLRLEYLIKIISSIIIIIGIYFIIKSLFNLYYKSSVIDYISGTLWLITVGLFVYIGFIINIKLVSPKDEFRIENITIPIIKNKTNLYFANENNIVYDNSSFMLSLNLKSFSENEINNYKTLLNNNGYKIKNDTYYYEIANKEVFINISSKVIVYGIKNKTAKK